MTSIQNKEIIIDVIFNCWLIFENYWRRQWMFIFSALFWSMPRFIDCVLGQYIRIWSMNPDTSYADLFNLNMPKRILDLWYLFLWIKYRIKGNKRENWRHSECQFDHFLSALYNMNLIDTSRSMACDGNHKLIWVYLFNDFLVTFDDQIDKKKVNFSSIISATVKLGIQCWTKNESESNNKQPSSGTL
jgi:hypothetical protein